MSAKNTPSNATAIPSVNGGSAALFASGSRMSMLMSALVVVVTALVFAGVTKLHWTNWDDDRYVYENVQVTKGDFKGIFTSQVVGNYNPLPLATHAIEWKLVKDKKSLEEKAFLFHLNNLWLHLLCTGLVYWLMLKLGLQPLWAGFAALMFGIHPMRVESVAWITERKDVLFGTFYVGAVIAYLRYQETKKWLPYVFGLALFVLALLSKIQAVSLPLALLTIDWYQDRKWTRKLLVEKIPFFLGAAAIGIVGVMILEKGAILDAGKTFGFGERVVLGLGSFCIYLVKSIFPYETALLYPYPKAVGAVHYLGMVAVIGIAIGAWWLRNRAREITFAILFFSVNIVFLLQIVGAGNAYQADRFSYIAYIGLCFGCWMLVQRWTAQHRGRWPVFAVAGLSMMGVFGYLTARYVPVWQNSETIWTDVIAKYPKQVVFAYINRGDYRRLHQIGDHGFSDFNEAIAIRPDFYMGYLDRGDIYFERGEDAAAIQDYSKVLELLGPVRFDKPMNPAAAQALGNRGTLYARQKRYKEALEDLDAAIRLQPKDKSTWNSRGLTYFELEDYPKAIADFTEFLKFEPHSDLTFNNRGVCHMRMNRLQEALADFVAALHYAPENPTYYLNRSIIHHSLGNNAAALADLEKVQSLGQEIDPALLDSLRR